MEQRIFKFVMLMEMSENFICSSKVLMYFISPSKVLLYDEHSATTSCVPCKRVLLCNSTCKFHYATQTASFIMQLKLQVSIHFLRNLYVCMVFGIRQFRIPPILVDLLFVVVNKLIRF